MPCSVYKKILRNILSEVSPDARKEAMMGLAADSDALWQQCGSFLWRVWI